MDTKAYDAIISELGNFFKTQEMKPLAAKGESEKVYANSEKAVKVTYDQQKKLFALNLGEVDGKQVTDWSELSCWLFDESHDIKDAKAIGADFEDILKDSFKMKTQKKRLADQDGGAVKGKGEEKNNRVPEAMAQRFLAICPQYKEQYNRDAQKYDAFLADDFFSKTAAQELISFLRANDKKPLERLFNMLNDFYLDGNEDTRSLITMTILAKLHDYPELQEPAFSHMSDYLAKSARAALQLEAKPKKARL